MKCIKNQNIETISRCGQHVLIDALHTPVSAVCFSGMIPMAKRIKLTQGKYAIVDDKDFNWLNQWKWHVTFKKSKYYVEGRVNGAQIMMHRFILGLKIGDKKEGDHRDGDGLNNQRCNLRECTHAENQYNRKKNKKGSSEYKGIWFNRKYKRWVAQLRCNKKYYNLGHFVSEIKAAKAYDMKAKEMFGEFASTNF